MTTETILRDPLAIAESWHAEGRAVALATVIETWGSAPRPRGSHLLVHGELPNVAQLAAYKTKLKGLRGLPKLVMDALELITAKSHPMDVMRTGCSMLGKVLPENE